ncbi:YqgE/AlgH family protein [Paraflavitalea pollutisoli]|uniref:YqgE/AlgH family protein n=1 Tax=Paraflavitalea pollutisoli TaxID=3034143 RepID=UPI0023EB9FA2|nr:YqgE/AlgH family protein [Paraflavitalea sp. H1-2-19X]
MKAGQFLTSTYLLDEDYFAQAVILLTECNEQGAMGFIINRPFARRFNELEEFKHSIAFPLYEGGPVDQEHLFFVHRRPDLIPGGEPAGEGLYIGGDFSTAVRLLNNKTLTEKDIRLFIGYCGWDREGLEAEIAEGSWTLSDSGQLLS